MSPKLYRRHTAPCSFKSREENKCECAIWIEWTDDGARIRQSMKTRDWVLASRKMKEMVLRGIHSCRLSAFKYTASRDRNRAEERSRLIQEQGGKCAICSTSNPGPKGWCLDHDHVTGQTRAVLCGFCNSILGFARESEGILLDAIFYLRKHRRISLTQYPEARAA
jgi:hypothetical protein